MVLEFFTTIRIFVTGVSGAPLSVVVVKVASSAEAPAAFTVGDLTVDLTARTVTVNNQPVHLTPLEYKLLATLIKHAGKRINVLPRVFVSR